MGNELYDRTRFARSLSTQLTARANQVRNLIGKANWYVDGHHKETLLRDILKTYLPTGITADRGFVLSRGAGSNCSTEQDILLVDQYQTAPLLSYAGLSICFPEHVVGSISVKTGFGKEELQDSIEGLSTICARPQLDSGVRFAGVFAFDDEPKIEPNPTNLANKCGEWITELGSRAQLGAATQWVLRMGSDHVGIGSLKESAFELRVFETDGLATAVFLARLTDALAEHRGGRSTLSDLLFEEQGSLEPATLRVQIEP